MLPIPGELTLPILEEFTLPILEEFTLPILEELSLPILGEFTLPILEELALPTPIYKTYLQSMSSTIIERRDFNVSLREECRHFLVGEVKVARGNAKAQRRVEWHHKCCYSNLV